MGRSQHREGGRGAGADVGDADQRQQGYSHTDRLGMPRPPRVRRSPSSSGRRRVGQQLGVGTGHPDGRLGGPAGGKVDAEGRVRKKAAARSAAFTCGHAQCIHVSCPATGTLPRRYASCPIAVSTIRRAAEADQPQTGAHARNTQRDHGHRCAGHQHREAHGQCGHHEPDARGHAAPRLWAAPTSTAEPLHKWGSSNRSSNSISVSLLRSASSLHVAEPRQDASPNITVAGPVEPPGEGHHW
jgi:hypothetical protein